ncbi:LamG-like jellyroll fold domain-containing protein [Gramella sp. AN32]|uniref:LamG-like jellyroll fold domain-containing protein n=1 Tax=Christiangramia antarctica TaxID=2058158 RepID=A0ABW5X623_9FLAO|nr:LamG-like jellyroll fold domain-containing protein [Gramella sp. AN32]MCM4154809.1 hypothetical protein [Gramella sp. AN32]
MHKITPSAKIRGVLLSLLFTLSFLVASNKEVAGIQITLESSTNIACFGTSTGIINVSVSGGNASTYTFSWTSPDGYSSNLEDISNLFAGTYTLDVTDGSSNSGSITVTLTENPELQILNEDLAKPTCKGNKDGQVVNMDITGGSGSYTYNISGGVWQNKKNFSNLEAGDYILGVKDSEGCTAYKTISLTEPDPVTITGSTSTPPTCFGQNTGTITAGSATGGTSTTTLPYQYKINGRSYQTSKIFENLSPGSYTLTVKDSNGCTATENISIANQSELIFSGSTATPVSCFGSSTGIITAANPNGGNPPYQFKIASGSYQDSLEFTGLPAGDYTVYAKDANSCEKSETITITQPEQLVISGSTFAPVSCNGGSDASITVGNVLGGTAPYEYSIDGTSWQTTLDFLNISAGNYTVYVKDANICTATEDIIVNEPAPLISTEPTLVHLTCFGSNEGSITAGTPSGGNGDYSYALENGSFSSSKMFSDLAAGTYNLKIRDSKNCEIVQTVVITEPDLLVMTAPSSIPTSCYDGADGTISVGSMTGGSGNFQYSIDNVDFTTSPTFLNVPAGNHTIFVKDANGCALQQTVTVSGPELLNASISPKNISCFDGADGTITLSSFSGGHGNYEISLDNLNWQPSAVFENLKSGSHDVFIRDANYPDCSILLNTVVLTQPSSAVTANVTTTRTTSYGSSTGTATANASGGTPGYTYEWRIAGSPTVIQVTKTATNLPAGDYEVTVKDSKGCSFQTTITIIDKLFAEILPTSICESEEEDAIRTSYFEVLNTTAIGGVGPYQYSWDFGDNAVPQNATGTGSHKINYTAVGNKVISLTVTDVENVSETFTLEHFVGQCYRPNCVSNDFIGENYFIGDENGNKITSFNCNSADQKYIYINLGSQSTRYSLYAELTYTVKNLSTGAISTFIENGCFYERQDIPVIARTIPIDIACGDIVTLQNIYLTFSNNAQHFNCGQGQPRPKCYSSSNQEVVETPLYAEAIPNEILCHGDNFGTIDVKASGGMSPYTYSITSATSGYQTEDSFSGLSAGQYNVHVKDYNGEVITIPDVTILQPTNPLTLQISATNPLCYGEFGEATVVAAGGTPFETGEAYQYLWNDATEQTTATAGNLIAGEYTVTVIDANGCQTLGTISLTEPEQLSIPEVGEPQTFQCGTNSTTLVANTPLTGIGKWTLDTLNSDAGGMIENNLDPNSSFSAPPGTYTLIWTIAHEDGSCSQSKSTSVTFTGGCSKLDFDGVDDHVIMGDTYDLSSGEFTIEIWVKPKSVSGIKTILSKRDFSNITSGGYDLVINNSAPTFRYNGSSVSTSSKIGTNRWYHLAVISNSSGIYLYVDGIKVGSNTAANIAPTSASFLLGGIYDTANPDVPRNYYHGWMEELRIWNKAVSEEQLRFLMNQRVEPTGSGIEGSVLTNKYTVPGSSNWNNLLGYYRLFPSEIVNSETIDISSNPVNGMLRNIETDQYNSAPLPYISEAGGDWTNRSTWDQNIGTATENWWTYPNDKGINGNPINWNIAKISHKIDSKTNNIDLLALFSEAEELTMTGSNSVKTGQSLTISHYLALDGIIDLDGESQLVQTEGSILEEASSGYLERDQQGTENSFNYNYWTSPVSVQGAANNSGYKIAEVLRDGTNPDNPRNILFDFWYEWADYSYSGAIHISSYWLYTFNNGSADNYSEWYGITENDIMPVGLGYSMKGSKGWKSISDTQNYTFRGKPNNGDITLNINTGSNLLVGNPYPSAISVTKFIDKNLNSFNGSIYLWDHFGEEDTHYLSDYIGGYAITNKSGAVRAISIDERINNDNSNSYKYPTDYIPVGQAFFISTVEDMSAGNMGAGGSITFKNDQRAFVTETDPTDSQFLSHQTPRKGFKSTYTKDDRLKIRLLYKGPQGYNRELLLTADKLSTNNFDLGYDAPLIEDNIEDMYWLINDYEYIIQAVPNFNSDQVLPIGVKLGEAGEFSIEVENMENLDNNFSIFIHNKKNHTYHNLAKASFIFDAEAGAINDQFEIVFAEPQDEIIGEPQEGISPTYGFNVDYLKESKLLVLENPNLLKINRVELFSISGQSIGIFENTPPKKVINLIIEKTLSSAVYIVKVQTEKGYYSKKIIIDE